MLGINFAKTFNTEIVDCKRESGTTGVVPPHARSNWDRCATAWSEVLLELVVSKDTGFFETTHSFANFKIGAALGVEVLTGEIAGIECLLRCAFAIDTHALKHLHLRAKEEIL
jgi:hypothetical protein